MQNTSAVSLFLDLLNPDGLFALKDAGNVTRSCGLVLRLLQSKNAAKAVWLIELVVSWVYNIGMDGAGPMVEWATRALETCSHWNMKTDCCVNRGERVGSFGQKI